MNVSVFKETALLHHESHGAAQPAPLHFIEAIYSVAGNDYFTCAWLNQPSQKTEHSAFTAASRSVQ